MKSISICSSNLKKEIFLSYFESWRYLILVQKLKGEANTKKNEETQYVVSKEDGEATIVSTTRFVEKFFSIDKVEFTVKYYSFDDTNSNIKLEG